MLFLVVPDTEISDQGAAVVPYDRKRPALDPCPVETVLAIVSGKWKVRVLYLLSLDRLGFAELRKATAGVSQQVLSSVLKELEADGIIRRTRTDAGSAYAVTADGRELVSLLTPVMDWEKRGLRKTASSGRRPRCRDQWSGPFARLALSSQAAHDFDCRVLNARQRSAISPTIPLRNASTMATKMTPWMTRTHSPVAAR